MSHQKEKTQILNRFKGKWIALRGKEKVVRYGETLEEILDDVKIQGKTISDELPDPRRSAVAFKLPKILKGKNK